MSINDVLTDEQITKCLDALAKKESASTPGGPVNTVIGRSKDKGVVLPGGQNYGIINQLNYVGKYQVGYLAMADTGWVRIGPKSNKALLDPSNWLGKMGIKSLDEFLTTPAAQEKAAREIFATNYRYLRKYISDCAPPDVAGYICASHLVGWGDAKKLREGINKCDANGCDAMYYFKLGYNAIAGKDPEIVTPPKGKDPSGAKVEVKPEERKSSNVVAAVVESKQTYDTNSSPRVIAPSRPDNVKVPVEVAQKYGQTGFIDPNLVYPKSGYKKFPDTNKLAYHLDISSTVVKKKDDNRHAQIPTANGDTWEEPISPYNAQYPYNKVTETESGHVIEYDDTPNAERIHVYHKAGTYTEINQDGSYVRRIVGDSYEVIDRNGNIFINGRCNLTVGGACNILILADANIDVKGNTNITSENDVNWEVSGNFNLQVNESFNVRTKNMNVEVDEARNEYVGQTSNEQVVGLVTQKYDAGISTAVIGNDARSISGNWSNKTGGKVDVQSGGNFNLDSSKIMLNSGAASPIDFTPAAVRHTNLRNAVARCAYTDNSTANIPYRSRTEDIAQHICEMDQDHAVVTVPPTTTTTVTAPATEIVTDSTGSKVVSAPAVTPATPATAPTTGGTNMTTSDGKPVTTTDYNSKMEINPEQFITMTDFPRSLKISKFFTVGDMLCGGVSLKAQCGLTVGQIVYNMSVLAQTVLDPIRYAHSNMAINSAFRIGEAKSQHNRGQACDMRFVGTKLSEYQKIAEWIRDNTKYDQIILESKKDDPRSLWIHVSVRTKTGGASAPGCKTAYNGGSSATPTVIAANNLDIGKLTWLDLNTYKSA